MQCSAEKLAALVAAVAEKLHCSPTGMTLKYEDDEGEKITLASDDALHDAVDLARAAGKTAVKLTAVVPAGSPTRSRAALPTVQETADERDVAKPSAGLSPAIIGGAVAVVAVLAGLGFVLSRKKN